MTIKPTMEGVTHNRSYPLHYLHTPVKMNTKYFSVSICIIYLVL